MAQAKKNFFCTNCGAVFNKWSGQCQECKSWDCIHEEEVNESFSDRITGKVLKVENLSAPSLVSHERITTSIGELNRVLGGGLVEGCAILIGGDPGIGKSTLLLQLAASLAMDSIGCLYVTGEESAAQVKMRAVRLGMTGSPMNILSASKLEDIIATVENNKTKTKLVVIDSIQTMFSESISSAPGTVSQVRASASKLISYAKSHGIILILVGHVTKEGEIAGPKILEHMVDTVLYFEGDRSYHFRILRSIKNRFGGINEIGVFEMRGSGLVEITNPSELFLTERENSISGGSIFASMEGTRPMLVEMQALVSNSNMPTPRRSVVGWDINRLSMLIAVLGVRYGLNLSAHEVYLTVAGGMKVTEPGADLAVVASIISTYLNKPLPEKTVLFGEISLSGEVRKVSQMEMRVKEAVKLGFKNIICSHNLNVDSGVTIHPIDHIKQLKSFFS